MLDERQFKAVECKSTGGNITDMSKAAKVSRNTIYKWIELEDFKAEVSRREQDFISSTVKAVTSYGPTLVEGLKDLAEHAVSEKVRLEARLALLNKIVSNATKVEITDGRDDKDNVSEDVLNDEIKEIDDDTDMNDDDNKDER